MLNNEGYSLSDIAAVIGQNDFGALAIDGEPVSESIVIVTPAATENYFNVASGIYVDVPSGCCEQLSIQNISAQEIDVQNANIMIERIA